MDKNRHAGRKIRRLELLIVYHLRSHGDDLIPPSQMRMLEFIELHDGCTQAEVAVEMGVSPASVAQSIKRMEAAGFVSRDACLGNMRAKSLHITPQGAAAARNCRSVFDRLEERLFSGFSEQEIDTAEELLRRMIDNLESADTGSMNNTELSKLVSSAPERGEAKQTDSKES